MAAVDQIKRARERATKAVSLRPAVGQATSVTRAQITDGYHCEVSEGSWTIAADMPKSEGGSERAPTPGVLGRGALASCFAIGLVGLAAQRDIPLDDLSVEVHADWDARGELGVGTDVVPGYSQVRIVVEIASPASEAAIKSLLEDAERHSPYIDVFRRDNTVLVEHTITQPVGA